MKYALRAAAGCLLVFALAVHAEDFWKRKPPQKWTVQESLQILQNSPWARQQLVAAATPGRRDADLSIPSGAPGCDPDAVDVNGNCLERRVNLPQDSSRAPAITFSQFTYAVYLLRWDSAAPVAAAFERLEELGERAAVAYQSPPPRRPADRYVITMKVLRPAGEMADPFAGRADSKEKQRVRLKTSRGIYVPLETERSGVGAGAAVHFFFPREQDGKPILNAKGETAEFVFEGAKVFLKCKFSVDSGSVR